MTAMHIKVGDLQEVDGQWFWGQSIEGDDGVRVYGPVFFGPYTTRKDADVARQLQIEKLWRGPQLAS